MICNQQVVGSNPTAGSGFTHYALAIILKFGKMRQHGYQMKKSAPGLGSREEKLRPRFNPNMSSALRIAAEDYYSRLRFTDMLLLEECAGASPRHCYA